jgi:hypothetical protein
MYRCRTRSLQRALLSIPHIAQDTLDPTQEADINVGAWSAAAVRANESVTIANSRNNSAGSSHLRNWKQKASCISYEFHWKILLHAHQQVTNPYSTSVFAREVAERKSVIQQTN